VAPPGTQTAATIAGYKLLERIGAGGYGEVWKAEAPGGLQKAIKFIYGYLDDERAACERKALERVKQVRHPFLLSLERIEIIDGQLVVVTELAEGSLRDRYEECRRAGRAGIDREELINYLRDAADALDFMCERHSLQHLDVKPENLLIVGGRSKVADFGLVKQVHEKTISLMGGLTPLYAAPEVFDGRPTLHSDQYSLAIVYQEMLTSVLPFPGRMPAQLAVQHANAQPRLGSLDPADRETIARALAKNPHERFASCRLMVDSLAEERRVQAVGMSDSLDQAGPDAHGTATAPVDYDAAASGQRATQSGATMALEPPAAAPGPRAIPSESAAQLVAEPAPLVEDLPPVEIDAGGRRMRPTVVLGIGGTAARTLRRLRGKLNDRFGDARAVPAVRMLLVDTDQRSILDAVDGDPRTALEMEETLAVPLRRPQHYRSHAERHLEWLSRRWLYNIPRSLKTQGLRPLGRLAFVDHAEAVSEHVRRAMAAAASPSALSASAEAVGATGVETAPRVYVVASISGGTGSGIVPDVAALVRQVSGRLQLPDCEVLGLLMHSTSRQPAEHDLAVANAHACLAELGHYQGTGRYPGDAASGLPASRDGPPVFHHTYLIALGEGLDERQLDAATDAVAQFLLLDATTPAGAFFDACRRTAGSEADGSVACPTLRTLGISQFGCSHGDLPDRAAELVCIRVIERWQGEVSADAEAEAAREADRFTRDVQLDVDSLAAEAEQVARQGLGQELDDFLRGLIKEDAAAPSPNSSLLRKTLDGLLGAPGADSAGGQRDGGSLQTAIETSLRETASKSGAAVSDWILQSLNCSGGGVTGARCRARAVGELLRQQEAELRGRLAKAKEELAECEATIAECDAPGRETRHASGWRKAPARQVPRHGEAWQQYGRLRLARLVLQEVAASLQTIRRQAAAAEDRLAELNQVLNVLAEQFLPKPAVDLQAAEPDSRLPATIDPQRPVPAELDGQIDQLAAEIDEQVRLGMLKDQDGLWALVDDGLGLVKQLPPTLRALARSAVLKAVRKLTLASLLPPSRARGPSAAGKLSDAFAAAVPALSSCGGGRRLLVVVPQEALRDCCTAEANAGLSEPSLVVDSASDLSICCEMERLPLRRVAATLIDHRPDYAEFAARLHTRIDVQWPRWPRQ